MTVNTLQGSEQTSLAPSKLDLWITQLNSVSWQERVAAAKSLAMAGQIAIPQLINAMQSEHFSVRYAATWALGRIGGDGVVGALCEALEDEHWAVRETAAHSLAKLKSKHAVPALMTATGDDIKQVRYAAIDALAAISNSDS